MVVLNYYLLIQHHILQQIWTFDDWIADKKGFVGTLNGHTILTKTPNVSKARELCGYSPDFLDSSWKESTGGLEISIIKRPEMRKAFPYYDVITDSANYIDNLSP